ncbi:MAG: hypothetical protein WCJ30_12175, partial [Deltaproteobacteria bacterium]
APAPWLVTGCGGATSSAPARPGSAMTTSTAAASGSDATSSRGRAATSESAPQQYAVDAPRAAPVTVAPGETTATGGYATPTGVAAGGSPGDRMTYWAGRLDQATSTMSSTGECRDICRANGDICTAAHEICVLTGDDEASTPTDGRCSRARTACEQATRQRNGACRVCPSE